jgi:putative peptide zinc metalloprotease protein
MRFGPTSLRVSSILAKGLRRPKFRADLRISEQTLAGEKSYVIKVPETNSYNRYGVSEYELLTLCDGTRTGSEVTAAWNERHPDEPFSESTVMEFLEDAEPGIWEQSAGERNLAVLERIRDDRKSRVDQSSMLYMTFKAWDPDRTLAKIDPYLSWMFTPGFVLFSVILFIIAAYLVAGDWTRVQGDTAALYTFQGKSAYDIWMFWILLFAVGAIHEFGHGLTCKHFGGDVHQMGFMLIYFTPAFFTDTTDILLFDRAGRRQWVLFAGIWIELVLCGIAALVWHFSAPGSVTNDLAYKLMLLSGIQGAFLNLNPLIKADGYYALSQSLHIDNLREDSFAFLRAWIRKYVLREDMDLPVATRRHRRIYAAFGISAVLYSVTLVTLVLLFVNNVFVGKFGNWGYVFTAMVIYLFARKGVKKALPQVRAWWREKREKQMAWKMTRAQQAGALCAALLFFIPPIPSKVASDFVLEPGKTAHLRAEIPGVLRQVFVRQGDPVAAGQTLAILENPEIEADAKTLAQQLAMANSDLRAAQGSSDRDKSADALREQARLEQEWSVAEQKVDALQIRAPFAGVVSTPLVEQRTGEYVSAGQEFCEVVDRGTMKARILVRDWELEYVSAGAKAQLKASPFPYRTYSGRVEQILPAAAIDRPVAQPQPLERMGQELTNYVAVVMDFPNPDGSLTEGMTGTAKIAGKDYPLAWQVGRGAWRWLRSQVW